MPNFTYVYGANLLNFDKLQQTLRKLHRILLLTNTRLFYAVTMDENMQQSTGRSNKEVSAINIRRTAQSLSGNYIDIQFRTECQYKTVLYLDLSTIYQRVPLYGHHQPMILTTKFCCNRANLLTP
jgi:hypothetical protein